MSQTKFLHFGVLKKLTKLGLLSQEIEEIYNIWGQNITILTLLCYCNCDFSSLKMLFNRNFPESLLLDRFYGKNALQYAIEHNNKENVEIILSKPKRRAMLLSLSEMYEEKTASVYARSLGFGEMGNYLDTVANANTRPSNQKEIPAKNKRTHNF